MDNVQFTAEELATEEWRTSPDFAVEVSNLGRVRHVLNGERVLRKLTQKVTATGRPGYVSVGVRSQAGKQVLINVHGLVAHVFLGPRPLGMQVNHIDADKTNNRASNLEYVTPKQNMQHAVRLGLLTNIARKPKPPRYGEDSSTAKLTSDQVIAIRQAILNGVKGAELAKRYGVTDMTISNIKTGKSWSCLHPERESVIAMGSWQTARKK